MRKGLLGFAASAGLLAALSAGSVQAATALDVAWKDTCGKASCFDDKGIFTQTFRSGGFGGPVTVGQLLLERGVLGALDGQTFRISFQLNGEELGAWGKYNMAGIGGDQLSFAGENFTWNPEDGDLVLKLEIVPPPKEGAGGFFMALRAPDEEGGDEGGGGDQQPLPGNGPPQTKPNDTGGGPEGRPQVGVVPEPSAWALMIGGFGMAGAMFRRRRAVLPAQP